MTTPQTLAVPGTAVTRWAAESLIADAQLVPGPLTVTFEKNRSASQGFCDELVEQLSASPATTVKFVGVSGSTHEYLSGAISRRRQVWTLFTLEPRTEEATTPPAAGEGQPMATSTYLLVDTVGDAVIEVRDAYPRHKNDADSYDVAEAVIDALVKRAAAEKQTAVLTWLDVNGDIRDRLSL